MSDHAGNSTHLPQSTEYSIGASSVIIMPHAPDPRPSDTTVPLHNYYGDSRLPFEQRHSIAKNSSHSPGYNQLLGELAAYYQRLHNFFGEKQRSQRKSTNGRVLRNLRSLIFEIGHQSLSYTFNPNDPAAQDFEELPATLMQPRLKLHYTWANDCLLTLSFALNQKQALDIIRQSRTNCAQHRPPFPRTIEMVMVCGDRKQYNNPHSTSIDFAFNPFDPRLYPFDYVYMPEWLDNRCENLQAFKKLSDWLYEHPPKTDDYWGRTGRWQHRDHSAGTLEDERLPSAVAWFMTLVATREVRNDIGRLINDMCSCSQTGSFTHGPHPEIHLSGGSWFRNMWPRLGLMSVFAEESTLQWKTRQSYLESRLHPKTLWRGAIPLYNPRHDVPGPMPGNPKRQRWEELRDAARKKQAGEDNTLKRLQKNPRTDRATDWAMPGANSEKAARFGNIDTIAGRALAANGNVLSKEHVEWNALRDISDRQFRIATGRDGRRIVRSQWAAALTGLWPGRGKGWEKQLEEARPLIEQADFEKAVYAHQNADKERQPLPFYEGNGRQKPRKKRKEGQPEADFRDV